MAAEDKNFRDHNGIDMKGIVRAAWNNFTGGDTQGASTITQQYARHAAELKEISYNRKLREAVIARKMEDEYTKDEILGRYLNSVYFGRGAYGIEAAVKAYFGNSRSSLTQPGQKGAITAGEAAVLASVIKQPEPSATHKGYDPQNNLTDGHGAVGLHAQQHGREGLAQPGGRRPAAVPEVAEVRPGGLPYRRAATTSPPARSSSTSSRNCSPWASTTGRSWTRAACGSPRRSTRRCRRRPRRRRRGPARTRR